MKLFYLLLTIFLFFVTKSNFVKAQEFKYGITLGIHGAKTTRSDNGLLKLKHENILGFRVSGIISYNLPYNLSVVSMPGLSKKGYKSDLITDKEVVYYVEIPIYAVYSYKINDYKLFAGLGPYLGMGISGKNYFLGERKVKFGSNKSDDLRRGDAGFGLMVGYDLPKGLQVIISTSYGLTNLNHVGEVTSKNRIVGISVSYWLN